MQRDALGNELAAFLASSPSPFHAVQTLADRLQVAGYELLHEKAPFILVPGGCYFTTRGGGSIVAFRLPQDLMASGLRMVGAHTDSPCLRLKPQPIQQGHGLVRLGVEVYGSTLLNPWFDRDLSLAGRVHFETEDGTLEHRLIDFRRPLALVPSVAIHLDREANRNRSINPQQDILPLAASPSMNEDGGCNLERLLIAQTGAEHPSVRPGRILDHELVFYDTQAPARVGVNSEFLASARLDNLVSCWCGLRSLLDSDPSVGALLICNDHEEVGSTSSSGAAGPFLRSVLKRIVSAIAGGEADAYARVIARSMLISADNAHAVHPNFPDLHDENHRPLLGGGPVIKINANQHYASSGSTQAVFRQLCDHEGIPTQTFVSRSDLSCGSTIGPITASAIGVRVLDVGVPQLAMHSIRELCHLDDPLQLALALKAFQSLAVLPSLD